MAKDILTPTTKTLKERLEAKSAPQPNGCIYWTGAITTDGYGLIRYGKRLIGAHRASHLVYLGEIPAGKHVCHRCDVRHCINPAHLFLGTHQENMRDMIEKGRQARGGANSHGRLTEEQILEIRGDARTQCEIAADYKITQPQVSYIKNRKCWSHLK